MPVEVTVPELGESITEVEVSAWLKQPGDEVDLDEPVIELESDKATVEVPAPAAGVVKEIVAEVGDVLKVGDVLARIDEDGDGGEDDDSGDDDGEDDDSGDDDGQDERDEEKAEKKEDKREEKEEEDGKDEKQQDEKKEKQEKARKQEKAEKQEQDDDSRDDGEDESDADEDADGDGPRVMPAARRILDEAGLDARDVEGSGPGGRVLKEDAEQAVAQRREKKGDGQKDGEKDAKRDEKKDRKRQDADDGADAADRDDDQERPAAPEGERETRTKRMSPIRRRIAERLVDSQRTAALLTTFNEIDMTRVKELRAEHRDAFEEKYGVKLGFMSFFVKASVEALRELPEVNAQIRDQEIVYHDYCDIGIAVGGGKGLVVPVIRNAEVRDFGDLERTIADFADRAQRNKLDLEELEGGTFTISNGGVYGSLMSTPIINPPQSGVLGLHAIQDRPVVIDGEIAVRPMMYVALTYDHRLVDGREAVTFLKHIKHLIERPERLLLKV